MPSFIHSGGEKKREKERNTSDFFKTKRQKKNGLFPISKKQRKSKMGKSTGKASAPVQGHTRRRDILFTATACFAVGWLVCWFTHSSSSTTTRRTKPFKPGEYEALCLHKPALNVTGPAGDDPPAGMVYYSKYWSDEAACGDRALLQYLESTEARLPPAERRPLRVFHMGTGGHHLLGLANRARPAALRHSIYAVTASPEEYSTYMALCIADGALGQHYHVWFGDAYNLRPEFVPDALDVVLLPHLGEYYTVVNHSEPAFTAPGASTDRTRYALLDDRALLALLVHKMAPGARLLAHNMTSGWLTANHLIAELVRSGVLAHVDTDGTVDAFVSLQ